MATNPQSLMERMEDALLDHSADPEFTKLATDEERIIWTRNFLSMPLVESSLASYWKRTDLKYAMKSSKDSEMYRNQGNKYFKDKLYVKALDLYTKSMIAAPAPDERDSDDRCLSKALSNRSAALFYLKEYKACLIDIEDALEAGYQQERQYLLHVRRVKCLHVMQLSTAAEQAFDEVVEILAKSKIGVDQQKRILKELEIDAGASGDPSKPLETVKISLPDLPHGSNASHPSLSSSCKVMYDTDKGRYVVATGNIRPGEVILVEQPYSSILTKGSFDVYCHHCCRGLPIAPIACQHCTKALFCSPLCRKNAWAAYHRYECSMVTTAECTDRDFLALRIVLVTGIDEMLKYRDEKTLPAEMTLAMAGCNEQGLYKPTDFNTVKHLARLARGRIFVIALKAARYLMLLEREHFFHSIPSWEKESAILYVGRCLMHILQALPVNCGVIRTVEHKLNAIHDIGVALHPTYALFNHSCASNSFLINYPNNVVIRARRTIKEGEEVTLEYRLGYLHSAREERQRNLQEEFYFKCTCEACVNDWPPLISVMTRQPVQFKCQNCQHRLCCNTSRDASPHAHTWCPGCKQRQEIPTIKQVGEDFLMRHQGMLNEALVVIEMEIVKFEKMVVNPRMNPDYQLWVFALEQCSEEMGTLYTSRL